MPRNTVSVDEMPSAYGTCRRCRVRRSVALSPNFRIAEHGGDLKTGRADLAQQRERQAPFLVEPERHGNAPALTRLWGQPLLGNVQCGPQHPGAHAGPQRCGDRHLAVGDLAQRPAVLAGHGDRAPALLRETRPIENQYGRALRNHRAELAPHALGAGVPISLTPLAG